MIMKLFLSILSITVLHCGQGVVDACDNVADMTDCNNNLTMNYFYAGSNMTKLCGAADLFIKCVDAFPGSCRQLPIYFDGIRWMNSKVTIDDCPELLVDDVPSTVPDPTGSSVSTCTCSAGSLETVSHFILLMIVLSNLFQ